MIASKIDAPPLARPPSQPGRPWCLFHCGPSGYAIGLESVAEVVEVDRLVRLPRSPPRILGLSSLRREVIPMIVLDAREDEPPAASSSLLALILRTASGNWAIRINPEGTLVAEEPLFEGDETARKPGMAVIGAVIRDHAHYTAIDPEATWQDVRRSVEDWYRNQRDRDAAIRMNPPRDGVGIEGASSMKGLP